VISYDHYLVEMLLGHLMADEAKVTFNPNFPYGVALIIAEIPMFRWNPASTTLPPSYTVILNRNAVYIHNNPFGYGSTALDSVKINDPLFCDTMARMIQQGTIKERTALMRILAVALSEKGTMSNFPGIKLDEDD